MLAHCKLPTHPPHPPLPFHLFLRVFARLHDIRVQCLSLEYNTMTLSRVQQTRSKALSMSCPDKKNSSFWHLQMRHRALVLCLLRKEVFNWWCKAWRYTRTFFSRNCQVNSNKLPGGRVAEWLGCWTCNLVVLGVSPLPQVELLSYAV